MCEECEALKKKITAFVSVRGEQVHCRDRKDVPDCSECSNSVCDGGDCSLERQYDEAYQALVNIAWHKP